MFSKNFRFAGDLRKKSDYKLSNFQRTKKFDATFKIGFRNGADRLNFSPASFATALF